MRTLWEQLGTNYVTVRICQPLHSYGEPGYWYSGESEIFKNHNKKQSKTV